MMRSPSPRSHFFRHSGAPTLACFPVRAKSAASPAGDSPEAVFVSRVHTRGGGQAGMSLLIVDLAPAH